MAYNEGQPTNAPPPYEETAPPSYNQVQSGTTTTTQPQPQPSAPPANHSKPADHDSQLREMILLTILLVHSLAYLILYAIYNETAGIDKEETDEATLAGFCIVFVGCFVLFLVYHFNVAQSAPPQLKLVCGVLIIIGGIILLITRAVAIGHYAEDSSSCQDDEYVCCACITVALSCILEGLSIIVIGAELVNSFQRKPNLPVALYAAIFVVAVLLIIIQGLANDLFDDEAETSQIVGFFGIIVFGIAKIWAKLSNTQRSISKWIGLGFGACIILTIYWADDVYFGVLWVGMGGYITYDSVC